jgi:hypothetical protein
MRDDALLQGLGWTDIGRRAITAPKRAGRVVALGTALRLRRAVHIRGALACSRSTLALRALRALARAKDAEGGLVWSILAGVRVPARGLLAVKTLDVVVAAERAR